MFLEKEQDKPQLTNISGKSKTSGMKCELVNEKSVKV
jgi:hypothetical protein